MKLFPVARSVVFIGAALILFGFGCKSPIATPTVPAAVAPLPIQHVPATKPPALPPPEPYTYSPNARPDHYTSPDVVYLRQVLTNFSKAQSFRAHLEIPTASGTAIGNIEYDRPVGLHGTLQIPGGVMTDVYLIGSDVYFRSNTSTWTNLGSTLEGQQVTSLFRSAFSLDGDATTTVSDTARVQSITDDPTGCRLYSFTQYTPDGNKVALQICVQNDLPTRLVTQTPAGNVLISYKDFDQPVEIIPPVQK